MADNCSLPWAPSGYPGEGATGAVKICCGPRCGAEPGHRLIYTAVEQAASAVGLFVVPTMCRSACSGGVTVILPNGTVKKVSDTSAANTVLGAVSETSA
ncbi:MAG: hypothetical protein H7145_16370 [Akkermansiaceae bacterium]|nr:hypothetical protein [Armatimonadota bacterium]